MQLQSLTPRSARGKTADGKIPALFAAWLLIWLSASAARAQTFPTTQTSSTARTVAITSGGPGSVLPADWLQGQRVDFLAMGDWGEGKPAEKLVAGALASYAVAQHVSFAGMLLAGDNFYVQLPGGVADPAWQNLFEKMYDPAALPMPFYVSLGNHDYDQRKDIIELQYAILHPDSRWKMPSRYYRLDLPTDHPLVTILMLDSNRQVLSDAAWAEQTRWMESELNKPRQRWTICVAHHPLFSNGAAGNNGVLQRDWGSLFVKYHVDFYVCGHEHNLQHLEVAKWPVSFVACGGGGAHASAMIGHRLAPFSRTVYGFAHLIFTPDRAIVSYIGTDDQPVHVFAREKSGKVTTLMSTPSDPGVTKPLEAIEGMFDKIHGSATQPATTPATAPGTAATQP